LLSSLQDITGLFPGLFQRGESAAAAENANTGVTGRGAGRSGHQHVDHGRHGHRHHNDLGRDRLTLSPEARAVEQAAQDDVESVGDAVAAETDSQSLLGQAGGFVRQALETIRHDLGKALKAFGFDSDAVQNFTKAFVEPVLTALKEGVNFTAELSFAAFSQVTAVSGGNVSQSTTLVAQSLEIEVNQDTGEVNVSLAKLSFQQDLQATGVNGQQPLLVIDPDDLANPQELAAKILASGEAAGAAAPETAPSETTSAEAAPAEGEAAAGEETAPAEALDQSLAEVRDKLAEEAATLRTRMILYSVTTTRNDKGETVTKLLLDAQLTIARFNDDATAQEEAQSLDLTA